MAKIKKTLLSIVFSIVILFGWSVFNSNNVNADEKVYEIGTDVTFPPFEFANDQNQYVGIDMDIIRTIAKNEGFKVKIKPVGFNAAVQALDAGQLDGVIAGTTITDERKQKMDFSAPYFKTGVVMAVGQNSSIKNFQDLKGKRVAIKTGTAAGDYAKSIQKKYGFKTVTFDDSNNVYNDVTTGNSVACFEDQPVMQYAIKTGAKLKIVTKPANGGAYGFSVKKGHNQELLKKFDAGLKKIKSNGQYKKIVAKYLGASAVASQKAHKTQNTFVSLWKQNQSALLGGLEQTVILTVLSIFFATIFGIFFGMLGVVPNKFANGVSTTVIYIFRGLPLLVLALFIYTGGA